MKRILSLILVCCLIFSCGGGGQEPLLKDGIENPESPVENPKKADETSKTGKGLIITSVVLGTLFVVSVLGNFALWDSGNQIKAHGEMTEAETEELTTSLTAIRNTHPIETDVISKQMQKQLDTNACLRRDLEEKAAEVIGLENIVNRLREWINVIKDYAQQSVAENKPDDNLLKMFVEKNFEYFTMFDPQPVIFIGI